MSAFVVSNEHINVIVTAANLAPHAALELGRTLLEENIASVAHRYRLNAASEEMQGYEQQLAEYAFAPIAAEPAQVLKAIDCLDYQSCEHAAWKTSAAKHVLDAMANRFAAHFKTEAYEHAAWGL